MREVKAVAKELVLRQDAFLLDQTVDLGYVNEEEDDEPESKDLENSELHEREAKSIFKRKPFTKTYSDIASSRFGSPSIHSGK